MPDVLQQQEENSSEVIVSQRKYSSSTIWAAIVDYYTNYSSDALVIEPLQFIYDQVLLCTVRIAERGCSIGHPLVVCSPIVHMNSRDANTWNVDSPFVLSFEGTKDKVISIKIRTHVGDLCLGTKLVKLVNYEPIHSRPTSDHVCPNQDDTDRTVLALPPDLEYIPDFADFIAGATDPGNIYSKGIRRIMMESKDVKLKRYEEAVEKIMARNRSKLRDYYQQKQAAAIHEQARTITKKIDSARRKYEIHLARREVFEENISRFTKHLLSCLDLVAIQVRKNPYLAKVETRSNDGSKT